MLVTAATYRDLTGDRNDSDANVVLRLTDAQERLEEDLDRVGHLEQSTHTEVLIPYRDGSLSPRATPITGAVGWSIDGDRLILRWNSLGVDVLAWYPNLGPTVTYTGGYVERTANPTAPNRVPLCIVTDLCWCAWRLARPVDPVERTAYPAGATSVQLGDAAVTFGPGGAAELSADTLRGFRWSAKTMRYRWREGRSVGC